MNFYIQSKNKINNTKIILIIKKILKKINKILFLTISIFRLFFDLYFFFHFKDKIFFSDKEKYTTIILITLHINEEYNI